MNKIAFYLDEVDRLRTNEPIAPVSCEVDTSNYCQNNCSFCISGDNKDATMMSMGFFRVLVDELKEAGVKSITFTGGGEPTCNPLFNDIADYANHHGFQLGLVTNGILLNEVCVELFEFVRVSVDAGTASVYRQIKGLDVFDKVVDNIQTVRDRCKTLGLSYVIAGQPAADLAEAESLAENLSADYIQIKPENGRYTETPILTSGLSIYSHREKETTELSCIIAGLVGIVTADGRYVFCCQHRYDPGFTIADLNIESLETAIVRRASMQYNINRSTCVSCRYATYAKAYSELTESRNIFLRHKEFL